MPTNLTDSSLEMGKDNDDHWITVPPSSGKASLANKVKAKTPKSARGISNRPGGIGNMKLPTKNANCVAVQDTTGVLGDSPPPHKSHSHSSYHVRDGRTFLDSVKNAPSTWAVINNLRPSTESNAVVETLLKSPPECVYEKDPTEVADKTLSVFPIRQEHDSKSSLKAAADKFGEENLFTVGLKGYNNLVLTTPPTIKYLGCAIHGLFQCMWMSMGHQIF